MTARYEADVVIAGGGLAGLVTAMELLDTGASVVLLERGPAEALGGLARWSFGGIFIVGSPEQRRTGIDDSPALALSDWLEYGQLDSAQEWPVRWADAYTSGCRELVYDWLRERGVRFFPVVHWVERGLHGEGNSVPRFHMVWGTGQRLVEALREQLEAHPRRERLLILHGHRVDDLVHEAGRVAGCSGEVERSSVSGGINVREGAFEARADNVVIASGGIMGNLELVRRHWPAGLGDPPERLLNGAHPSADGSLHAVAERHGASVTHLDRMWLYAAGVEHWKPEHEAHGLSLVPPKSALWVDAEGRRLGPPAMVSGFDTRYLVEAVCHTEARYSWQILNTRIARRELAVSGSELNRAMRDRRWARFLLQTLFGNRALVRELCDRCPDFVTADSLSELAAGMVELAGDGLLDPARLQREVCDYDAAVDRGRRFANDDQARRIAHARRYRGDRVRTCKSARIDDARGRPLIAIRERITTRKSLGGIRTDLDCRVLDREGEAMDGLYAVGEAAGFGGGGIHGSRSLEGTFLGNCIFGGRLAARAIGGSAR